MRFVLVVVFLLLSQATFAQIILSKPTPLPINGYKRNDNSLTLVFSGTAVIPSVADTVYRADNSRADRQFQPVIDAPVGRSVSIHFPNTRTWPAGTYHELRLGGQVTHKGSISFDYETSRPASQSVTIYLSSTSPPVAVTLIAGSVSGGSGSAGPPGPQGSQGIPGPKGDKGDTGAAGPQGIQGIQGPVGPAGLAGLQGPKGDTGLQGIQGPVGLTGLTGPQGVSGVAGAQGPKGDTGTQGIQGLTGATGSQGVQGIQGPKGDTGSQGPVGLTGPAGTTFTTGYGLALISGILSYTAGGSGFSGNYNDLTNKPVLFSGLYADLSGKPTTFPPAAHAHVIGDVTGLTAELSNRYTKTESDALYKAASYVPTWADVTGKPIFFSGNYADLSGRPVIPSATSQLSNDSDFRTGSQVGSAISSATSGLAPLASPTFTGTPAVPTATVGNTSTQIASTAFVQAATVYAYLSATDANYTISGITKTVKLPVITANRTVTLPNPATNSGKPLKIWNQNTSAFSWNVSGTLRDNANAAITTLANNTWYMLESDGSSWLSVEVIPGAVSSAINSATAAASNALSVANSKQSSLTLTTTGSSGAASLTNGVLNIPQYSGSGGTASPTSITLTSKTTAYIQSVINSCTGTPTIIVYPASLGVYTPTARLEFYGKSNITFDGLGSAVFTKSSGAYPFFALLGYNYNIAIQGISFSDLATSGDASIINFYEQGPNVNITIQDNEFTVPNKDANAIHALPYSALNEQGSGNGAILKNLIIRRNYGHDIGRAFFEINSHVHSDNKSDCYVYNLLMEYNKTERLGIKNNNNPGPFGPFASLSGVNDKSTLQYNECIDNKWCGVELISSRNAVLRDNWFYTTDLTTYNFSGYSITKGDNNANKNSNITITGGGTYKDGTGVLSGKLLRLEDCDGAYITNYNGEAWGNSELNRVNNATVTANTWRTLTGGSPAGTGGSNLNLGNCNKVTVSYNVFELANPPTGHTQYNNIWTPNCTGIGIYMNTLIRPSNAQNPFINDAGSAIRTGGNTTLNN